VITALTVSLLGCSSDGHAEQSETTEIAGDTTDGFDWSAVLSEQDGKPCVGFVVEGEPMGQTCDADGAFPERTSVVEYVGSVTQGMDRTGFIFLSTDRADEVTVTFDDGQHSSATFSGSDDVPSDRTATAFVGPRSADPVQVRITDADGEPLLDYEIRPPTSPFRRSDICR
jgi:hypothetical protein